MLANISSDYDETYTWFRRHSCGVLALGLKEMDGLIGMTRLSILLANRSRTIYDLLASLSSILLQEDTVGTPKAFADSSYRVRDTMMK